MNTQPFGCGFESRCSHLDILLLRKKKFDSHSPEAVKLFSFSHIFIVFIVSLDGLQLFVLFLMNET